MQPRHVTAALPEDERVAVEVLETHLYLRTRGPNPALEILDDGTVGVFLTIGYVQRLLKKTGSRKKGEDYAAEILNQILPRLGLLERTNLTKKPRRARSKWDTPTHNKEGGRHAQPTTLHSYWWKIYRVPALNKLLAPRAGAYPHRLGFPAPPALGLASLFGLLRCQGLISARSRRRGFGPGSVQAAFQATGPP